MSEHMHSPEFITNRTHIKPSRLAKKSPARHENSQEDLGNNVNTQFISIALPSVEKHASVLKAMSQVQEQHNYLINLQKTFGNAYVQMVVQHMESQKAGAAEPDPTTGSTAIPETDTSNSPGNVSGGPEITSEETAENPEIAEFVRLCRDNGVSEEIIQEVSNNPQARVQLRMAIESGREAWKELFSQVLEKIDFKTASKVLGVIFSVNAAIDKAARGDYRGAAAEIVNLGVTGVLGSVAAVSMIANALTALFPDAYGYFQIFNASNTIDALVRLVSGDFDISDEEYIKLNAITDAIHNIPIFDMISWTAESLFDLFNDNQYLNVEDVRRFLLSENSLSSLIKGLLNEGVGAKLPELKSSLLDYYTTRIAYPFHPETRLQAEGLIMRLNNFAVLLQNIVIPQIRSSGEVDNPERYALYIYEQFSPYDPPYAFESISENISLINDMGSYNEELPPEEIQNEWFSDE
jgi:hypothetical protein